MLITGYALRLHRYLKYDGTTQGIPLCYLHTDSIHKSHNDILAINKERFDWVNILIEKINGTTAEVTVQLCGLLEVEENYISSFWFFGLECKKLNRSKETFCPFPSLQYVLNKNFEHLIVFSKVDCINQPALVIPTTLNANLYSLQLSAKAKRNAMFTLISFGFFFRDDWGCEPNSGNIIVQNNFNSMEFIATLLREDSESGRSTKLTIYDQLKLLLKETQELGRLKRQGREQRKKNIRVLTDVSAMETYRELAER
jgi:hypothetical protein